MTLQSLLDVQRPIVQAPMGGTAGPALVGAVSASGGLGILACTWSTPEQIEAEVAQIRRLTDRPFAANLCLPFEVAPLLDVLLALAVPVISFAWGQPGPEVTARCQAAGTRVGLQIGSASGARVAVQSGVDFLIAQGVEAGGHVQSTTPLTSLLDETLAAAGDVPVVAAGGLATREDVAAVLDHGAAGAMLGTRFVATYESEAHPDYRQALVAADSDDSRLTLCFDGTWPFAPHRVLRNATLDRWEAAGCPPPGQRPGEGDGVLLGSDGTAIPRYSDVPPRAGDSGRITDACLYAGRGVGRIHEVLAAADVVRYLDPAELK